MKSNINYSLYLVTDSKIMSVTKLEDAVEQAIQGGCSIIQLREKNLDSLEFYNQAMKIKKVCLKYQIPLIINDRVDIALAIDADGIHVGQKDLNAKIVRKLIGKNKILGISVSNLKEAKQAEIDKADYVGVGAVFTTKTKDDASNVSIETLINIKKNLKIPVVAIGGINEQTIDKLRNTNIDGVAIVSAIIGKKNIKQAAKNIKELTKII
ncbi:thiamine phosphate synthase [Mycoplasma sp. P36-A1]|uniref:thiamine phosphate synthase n=1 Tax=Mycoplasma sp. P36-A1 TaxID=3252900 RepID=UPI003C2E613A